VQTNSDELVDRFCLSQPTEALRCFTCHCSLNGDLRSPPNQGPHADGKWLDFSLPGQDDQSPLQALEALRGSCQRWNYELHQDLIEALQLLPHFDKELHMLSTGSRRKVALAELF